ncbi:bem46 protein, variant [Mucor velutinosus]|uniref:Bem46 protein, variant n=1 Tax=Mucor velutinosus TaxID=708070 RepID=A0AAN7D4I4_9FUNG|nr:bem46 protein, variant [Mucor velutinosus]
MTRARKESAFHLALLVLVQWISLAVVILNATALYLLRSAKHSGLVNVYSSPADYMLLILGSLSFVGSTVYLFLHFHLYFRIIDEYPFTPSKSMSAVEVMMAVILIALWTVATSVILTHSQEATSPCRFTSSFYTHNHSDICELFDTTLMLAFAAVGGWVLVLLATLFILIRSPIPPTTIFTIEAPPQRFSQPMVVSLPDEAYCHSGHPPSRPYYMGHYNNNNKIRPVSEDMDAEQQIILATNNSSQRNKRKSMMTSSNSASSVHASTSRFAIEHVVLDDAANDDLASATASSNIYSHYYSSYYQPQHILLSSPSNTNSSGINNATSASSYYSSRCQIPQVESQRTFQSLSTIESAYRSGCQPIQFDLPIIQVGMLSHIDVSFLQKKS